MLNGTIRPRPWKVFVTMVKTRRSTLATQPNCCNRLEGQIRERFLVAQAEGTQERGCVPRDIRRVFTIVEAPSIPVDKW